MNKKFTSILIASIVILSLLSTMTVFAGTAEPPRKQTIQGENGEVITIVSQDLRVRAPSNGRGGRSPTLLVDSHTITYSLCYGWIGNTKTFHCYAKTNKISGSGPYKTHAHAALIKGNSGGVSYGDTLVFGYPPTSCASKTITNATSTTCRSPDFSTYWGQWWYAISGHKYDVGADGVWDWSCNGCIDTKYKIP